MFCALTANQTDGPCQLWMLPGREAVIVARAQTLRELHAEAAGRNEALVALEALTKESGARQERLREAMQACQHLQSELEAAQVAPVLIGRRPCASCTACGWLGSCCQTGASEFRSKGGWPSAGDEVLERFAGKALLTSCQNRKV